MEEKIESEEKLKEKLKEEILTQESQKKHPVFNKNISLRDAVVWSEILDAKYLK